MRAFTTSPAPHVVRADSVRRIMLLTAAALLPAVFVHTLWFGAGLAIQILIAAAAAIGSEAVMLRLRKQPVLPFLADGSALVTAMLLALALPPLAPWWLAASGAAFGIIFGKHLYGGLGRNLFNPAMVGYAVLLVSFPAQMTLWPPADGLAGAVTLDLGQALTTIAGGTPPAPLAWDAVTAATPLDTVRAGLLAGQTMEEVRAAPVFGAFGGRGWDWVQAAIVLGGLFLLAVKVIRWHIPAAVLAAVFVFAALMHAVDPGTHPDATFHLASGATLLGAFFIACDPVTAPASTRGRLLYGAGIGCLAYVIRTWGGYPDGVAFAVLILNAFVPLLDRYTIPRIYGHARRD